MVVLYLLIATEFRVRTTLTVVVLLCVLDLMYSETNPLHCSYQLVTQNGKAVV